MAWLPASLLKNTQALIDMRENDARTVRLFEGVSTQIQSSGLVAHENNTFINLALAVCGPFMA